MRIGLVADIHCDIEGLKLALQAMGPIDELLCAGDAIYEYRFSNDVYSLLRHTETRMVMGNHDVGFLTHALTRLPDGGAEQEANIQFAKALPAVLTTQVNGKRLHMAHGSPVGMRGDYVYPNSGSLREIADLGHDFVILGHTHNPMAKRVGKTLIINPGSCSESRTARNRSLLTCAVLDTQTDEVKFFGFPNPKLAEGEPPFIREYSLDHFRQG